ERHAAKLSSLTDAQRTAVESLTKGIVAKLLPRPSVRLKDDAGTPKGERNAAAVRDMFDLP
ncbi:MAG: glutamyl-tRNA reductase, partial [Ilumatobacteraceae bacterium]